MTPTKTGTEMAQVDAKGQGGPGVGTAGLKAERIQTPAVGKAAPAPAGDSKLKAERIQLVLKDLPGWQLDGGGRRISRRIQVTHPREIAELLRFVADLAFSTGVVPRVTTGTLDMVLHLPTIAGRFLTQAQFELAQLLDPDAVEA